MIDTKGLQPEAVLKALYDRAKAQGFGLLHYTPQPMVPEEARSLLSRHTSFDYIYGRAIKVDLSNSDGFEEWLYDRDNGNGAAQAAIDGIKQGELNG